jgi:hypothetical protein
VARCTVNSVAGLLKLLARICLVLDEKPQERVDAGHTDRIETGSRIDR